MFGVALRELPTEERVVAKEAEPVDVELALGDQELTDSVVDDRFQEGTPLP